MKKILIILSVLGLAACDTYTVKNSLNIPIEVNGSTFAAGSCTEVVDFFNLIGDFPLIVGKSGGTTPNNEEYGPGNYEAYLTPPNNGVNLKEVDDACAVFVDVPDVKKPTAKQADEEKANLENSQTAKQADEEKANLENSQIEAAKKHPSSK